MERLADMYGEQLREICPELLNALQEFQATLDFSSLLRVVSLCDRLQQAMLNRTVMRTHSESFAARHPNNTSEVALDLP
jgi:hypothetical protein